MHTSAYVDQNDLHQAELTVRETLDFAARCQGIGHKAGKAPSPTYTFLVADLTAADRLYHCFGFMTALCL